MAKIKKSFHLNPNYSNWKNEGTLDDCLDWFGCPEGIEGMELEFSIGDGLFLDDLWNDAFDKGEGSPEWLLAEKYNKIDEPDFNLIRRKSDSKLLTDVKLSFTFDDEELEYSNIKITGKNYVSS